MERRGRLSQEVKGRQHPNRGNPGDKRNGEADLDIPSWLSEEAKREFLDAWDHTFNLEPMRSLNR